MYGGHDGVAFFVPRVRKDLRFAPFAVLADFEPPSARSDPAHDTHAAGCLTQGSKGTFIIRGYVPGLNCSPSAGSRGVRARHGPFWPFFGAPLLSLRARVARVWALQLRSTGGSMALSVVGATAPKFWAALLPWDLLAAETTFASFWCAGLVAANLVERHNQPFVSSFVFCTTPLAFPPQLLGGSHFFSETG